MRYYSEFADINGVEYQVTIETSSGSGTTNFTLGGTPFVTEMESEEKHLYSPIKTIGATVTMVTDSIPFDIYSGSALGTKVTLTSEGKTKWVGFVTPCVFDMGFDNDIEELEIECVDGIAALKDLQYQDDTHDIATFGDILFKCLKRSGVYSNLYISDNVQLTSNGNDSVINLFRISQQNFFDEKDDIGQTDDDVAWSCYDVLYEICQYLGYTIYADGDDVYIIDYDAIKAGINTYYKYSLTGDSIGSGSQVTLSYNSYIDGDSYAENGTKISLDEIYNKITVSDNFYTYDSLFPEFGDEAYETNITPTSDSGLSSLLVSSGNGLWVADTFAETDKNGNNTSYQIMVGRSWRNRTWLLIWKFYYSPVFEFYKYNTNSSRTDVTSNMESSQKYSDMFNYHGAYYAKLYKRNLSGTDYNNWRNSYPSNWSSMSESERKAAWLALINKNPESLDMTPTIVCLNQDTNHIGPGDYNTSGLYRETDDEDCRNYPFIRLRGDYNSSIFGGSDSYLIIQGTYRYHDELVSPYPLYDGADNGDLSKEGDLKYADQGFVWCRLQWGDQYWDGSSWTSTPSDFKMKFWDDDMDRSDRKNKKTYDKDFDFLDTAAVNFGCEEKGYYIPAPTSGNLTGTADFIIYANRDMWGKSRRGHWNPSNNNYYQRYYQKCVFITNLSVTAKVSNGLLDDEGNDTDTVYTNVISNGAVDELDEIEFKICTYDYKNPTYSSVDYLNSGASTYVSYTYNKALTNDERSTEGTDGITGALRQEEHYVYKLTTQYEEPRVILEANLHNDDYKMYGTYTDKTLSGKTFVIQEISTDYKMNQQNIKFLEKA